MGRLFKWLEARAAKQSLFNVGINTRTLILVSNTADAAIHATGSANPSHTNEVVAAQKSLLADIQLALANGAELSAVQEAIEKAKAKENVTEGAKMAIENVLKYVVTA